MSFVSCIVMMSMLWFCVRCSISCVLFLKPFMLICRMFSVFVCRGFVLFVFCCCVGFVFWFWGCVVGVWLTGCVCGVWFARGGGGVGGCVWGVGVF